jgi:hypothetical protein
MLLTEIQERWPTYRTDDIPSFLNPTRNANNRTILRNRIHHFAMLTVFNFNSSVGTIPEPLTSALQLQMTEQWMNALLNVRLDPVTRARNQMVNRLVRASLHFGKRSLMRTLANRRIVSLREKINQAAQAHPEWEQDELCIAIRASTLTAMNDARRPNILIGRRRTYLQALSRRQQIDNFEEDAPETDSDLEGLENLESNSNASDHTASD